MEIYFYPPGDDDFNTFSYICDLTEKQRRILFKGLQTIEQLGFSNGKKTQSIKSLNKKEKIYEFIIGNHRLLFCVIRKKCWVLHGFLKKSQKTNKRDIQTAINLKYKLLNLLNKE